jgi:transcriptional regulator with XRE-family HTH domain
MDEPTWWTYIRSVAHTEVLQPIADAAGVSTPQASRWKSGQNKPDADKLVRLARHYQQPPVAALIAGGYLTKEEAHAVVEIQRGAGDLTDEELLEEVQRRMKELRDAVEASQKSSTSETLNEDEEVTLSGKRRKKSDDVKPNDPLGGLRKKPGVRGAE